MITHKKNYLLTASEFNWKISEDKNIRAWGFNEQLPGPVLRAKKGEELVVQFTNLLTEPTIVHWHGLQIPNPMDGTELVQQEIQPGESFEYRFQLPDAGTYWYHSHYNETVQVERGMYGAIVIEDDSDPVVDDDKIFVLDDMKLNANSNFARPSWFLSRWLERHNGREGKTLLVNGRENPTVKMNAGQIERWRFINASNARYYRISLGNLPFHLIATDGRLLDFPEEETEFLIAPGERYDLLVGPFAPDTAFRLESLPYDRGAGKSKKATLATVAVGARQASRAVIPEALTDIQALAPYNAPATRTLKLHGKRSWKDGVDFTINDKQHLHDAPVYTGELQIWDISNPSMMDHPFHLHGFFFQVLAVNGQPVAYISWKDTVNVKKGDTVKIAWLPDGRTGSWMYHCHILEHHAAGMMGHFEVIDRAGEGPRQSEHHGHCA